MGEKDLDWIAGLNDFRGERDNFHELFVTKFAGNRPEDTSTAGIQFLINNYNGIAVEAEIRTIIAANRLTGANHNRIDDFTLFYRAIRSSFLNVRFDDIADTGIALI